MITSKQKKRKKGPNLAVVTCPLKFNYFLPFLKFSENLYISKFSSYIY